MRFPCGSVGAVGTLAAADEERRSLSARQGGRGGRTAVSTNPQVLPRSTFPALVPVLLLLLLLPAPPAVRAQLSVELPDGTTGEGLQAALDQAGNANTTTTISVQPQDQPILLYEALLVHHAVVMQAAGYASGTYRPVQLQCAGNNSALIVDSPAFTLQGFVVTGCSQAALLLAPPPPPTAAAAPVPQDIRLDGCTFAGNMATNSSDMHLPDASMAAWLGNATMSSPFPATARMVSEAAGLSGLASAAAVLAPDFLGTFHAASCDFLHNTFDPNTDLWQFEFFGLAAWPAVMVLCAGTARAANGTCSMTLSDVHFEDNRGIGSAGAILACVGDEKTLALSRCDVALDNVTAVSNAGNVTAAWMPFPYKNCADPEPGILSLARFGLLPAAVMILLTTQQPSSVGVLDCVFDSNLSGGLFIYHGKLSTWEDDGAGCYGSNLVSGSTIIDNSSFSHHAAGLPAAFVCGGSTLVLARSNFSDVTGGLFGAASEAHVSGCNFQRISSSTCLRNYMPKNATGNGGAAYPNGRFGVSALALFLQGDAGMLGSVVDTVFHNNSNVNGGSLYIDSNNQFLATNPGAIPGTGVDVVLQRVNFTQNIGLDSGRAMWLLNVRHVDCEDVVFSENWGGAFLAQGAQSATFRRPVFIANYFNDSKQSTSFPTGPSLVLDFVVKVNVTDGVFSNNWGTTMGGAIKAIAANNIQDPTFGAVGAPASTSLVMNVKNCSFVNNTIANADPSVIGRGGAVHAESYSMVDISNCSFKGNSASERGGALSLASIFSLHVADCKFWNNTCALIERFTSPFGQDRDVDQPHGGGAVFGSNIGAGGRSASGNPLLYFSSCDFAGNAASRGGAVRLLTVTYPRFSGCNFTNNRAAMQGGALHINTAPSPGLIIWDSVLQGNYAAAVSGSTADSTATYGGAMYLVATDVRLECTFLLNNTATVGGAVYALLATFFLMGQQQDGVTCQLWGPEPATNRKYATVFGNNSAVAGGAIFLTRSTLVVWEVSNANWGRYYLLDDDRVPGILFKGNTARGGGALLLYDTSELVVIHATFLDNVLADSSLGPASVHNASQRQLHGRSVLGDSNSANLGNSSIATLTYGCRGAGGAVCIVGGQGLTARVNHSVFIGNAAIYGGAMYITAGPQCTVAEGCFSVSVKDTDIRGNRAVGGGGGGVYWAYRGILSVDGCQGPLATDYREQLPSGGLGAAVRISVERQYMPCAGWVGSNSVAGAAYGAAIASPPFYLAVSEDKGRRYYLSNSNLNLSVSAHDYYGQLCRSAENSTGVRVSAVQASFDEVISSASLASDSQAAGLGTNVTALAATPPTASSTSESVSLSGATVAVTVGGVAAFPALRMRAAQGPHIISMMGTLNQPLQELEAVQVLVITRPCNIGEYLSDTGDECLPCRANYFNINVTSTECVSCPEHAHCNDPSIGDGVIVPDDGYWHTNPFSFKVQQCPYKDACTKDDRLKLLADLQNKMTVIVRTEQQAVTTAKDAVNALFDQGNVTAAQQYKQYLLQVPRDPSGLESLYSAAFLLRDEVRANYSTSYVQCAIGYTGPLCANCAEGYGSTGNGQCTKCPSSSLNTLYYAMAAVLTLLLLCWAVRTAIVDFVKTRKVLATDKAMRRLSASGTLQTARGRTSTRITPINVGTPPPPPRRLTGSLLQSPPTRRASSSGGGALPDAGVPSLDTAAALPNGGLAASEAGSAPQMESGTAVLELEASDALPRASSALPGADAARSDAGGTSVDAPQHGSAALPEAGAAVLEADAALVGGSATLASAAARQPASLSASVLPAPADDDLPDLPDPSSPTTPNSPRPECKILNNTHDRASQISAYSEDVDAASAPAPTLPPAPPTVDIVTAPTITTRRTRRNGRAAAVVDDSLPLLGPPLTVMMPVLLEGTATLPLSDKPSDHVAPSDGMATPELTSQRLLSRVVTASTAHHGSVHGVANLALLTSQPPSQDGQLGQSGPHDSDAMVVLPMLPLFAQQQHKMARQAAAVLVPASAAAAPAAAAPPLASEDASPMPRTPSADSTEQRGAAASASCDGSERFPATGPPPPPPLPPVAAHAYGQVLASTQRPIAEASERGNPSVFSLVQDDELSTANEDAAAAAGGTSLSDQPAAAVRAPAAAMPSVGSGHGRSSHSDSAALDAMSSATYPGSPLHVAPASPSRFSFRMTSLQPSLPESRGSGLISAGSCTPASADASTTRLSTRLSAVGDLPLSPAAAPLQPQVSTGRRFRHSEGATIASLSSNEPPELLPSRSSRTVDGSGALSPALPPLVPPAGGNNAPPRPASGGYLRSSGSGGQLRQQHSRASPGGGERRTSRARMSLRPTSSNKLNVEAYHSTDSGATHMLSPKQPSRSMEGGGAAPNVTGQPTTGGARAFISDSGAGGLSLHSAFHNAGALYDPTGAHSVFGASEGATDPLGDGFYWEELDDDDIEPEQAALNSTLIKILVTHVQLLAMLQRFPLAYPLPMNNFFRFCNQATSYPGTMVSLDCSLPSYETVSHATARTLISVLAPFYIGVFSGIFWSCWFFIRLAWTKYQVSKGTPHKTHRHGILRRLRKYLVTRLVISMNIIMFYFYPNVVQTLLGIFNCTDIASTAPEGFAGEVEDLGGSYWSDDITQACGTGSHRVLQLAVGIPLLVLIAVAWPVSVGLFLWWRGIKDKRLSTLLFAFYYEGYNYRNAYWESIIMLRKLSVALVISFLNNPEQGGMAMLLVTLIYVCALAAQHIVKPFQSRLANTMEECSLMMLIFTTYMILYLTYPVLSSSERLAITCIIITFNAIFLICIIVFIGRGYYRSIHDSLGLAPKDLAEMDDAQLREHISKRIGDGPGSNSRKTLMVVTAAKTLKHMDSMFVKASSLKSQLSLVASTTSFRRGSLHLGNSIKVRHGSGGPAPGEELSRVDSGRTSFTSLAGPGASLAGGAAAAAPGEGRSSRHVSAASSQRMLASSARRPPSAYGGSHVGGVSGKSLVRGEPGGGALIRPRTPGTSGYGGGSISNAGNSVIGGGGHGVNPLASGGGGGGGILHARPSRGTAAAMSTSGTDVTPSISGAPSRQSQQGIGASAPPSPLPTMQSRSAFAAAAAAPAVDEPLSMPLQLSSGHSFMEPGVRPAGPVSEPQMKLVSRHSSDLTMGIYNVPQRQLSASDGLAVLGSNGNGLGLDFNLAFDRSSSPLLPAREVQSHMINFASRESSWATMDQNRSPSMMSLGRPSISSVGGPSAGIANSPGPPSSPSLYSSGGGGARHGSPAHHHRRMQPPSQPGSASAAGLPTTSTKRIVSSPAARSGPSSHNAARASPPSRNDVDAPYGSRMPPLQLGSPLARRRESGPELQSGSDSAQVLQPGNGRNARRGDSGTSGIAAGLERLPMPLMTGQQQQQRVVQAPGAPRLSGDGTA